MSESVAKTPEQLDEEECREVNRVLSKGINEFTERNAAKNAAGFKIS